MRRSGFAGVGDDRRCRARAGECCCVVDGFLGVVSVADGCGASEVAVSETAGLITSVAITSSILALAGPSGWLVGGAIVIASTAGGLNMTNRIQNSWK